jgi:hypothetical protein
MGSCVVFLGSAYISNVAVTADYVYVDVHGNQDNTGAPFYITRIPTGTSGTSMTVTLSQATTAFTYSAANNAIYIGGDNTCNPSCTLAVSKIDLASLTVTNTFQVAGSVGSQIFAPENQIVSIYASSVYLYNVNGNTATLVGQQDISDSSTPTLLSPDVKNPNDIYIGFFNSYVSTRGGSSAKSYQVIKYSNSDMSVEKSVQLPASNFSSSYGSGGSEYNGAFGFGVSNGYVIYGYQASNVFTGVATYNLQSGMYNTATRVSDQCSVSSSTASPSTTSPSTESPSSSASPSTESPSSSVSPSSSSSPADPASSASSASPSISASPSSAPSTTTTAAPGSNISGDNNARTTNSAVKAISTIGALTVLVVAML